MFGKRALANGRRARGGVWGAQRIPSRSGGEPCWSRGGAGARARRGWRIPSRIGGRAITLRMNCVRKEIPGFRHESAVSGGGWEAITLRANGWCGEARGARGGSRHDVVATFHEKDHVADVRRAKQRAATEMQHLTQQQRSNHPCQPAETGVRARPSR